MDNTFGADVNKGPPPNKHKQNHYVNNKPLEQIQPLCNHIQQLRESHIKTVWVHERENSNGKHVQGWR